MYYNSVVYKNKYYGDRKYDNLIDRLSIRRFAVSRCFHTFISIQFSATYELGFLQVADARCNL